ncbi:alpha/beta hydrolase [Streptomyces sp. NPDC007107]|uniref:alpha/beta fold hydrolase n=1 Tax=Streptomyces sp. NPDC007107 TaxID=3156915 RepID=UPI0033F13B02
MLTPRTVPLRPGLDLALREAGHGRPVLVLHGGPGPAGIVPLISHLATDHAVLAPTHPGWEDTMRPDDLDSVPALAAAYLDLLRHLALHDVTVIGTSFGGWAATQAALDDHEDRISQLILIDAIGPVIPGQQISMPSGPPPAPAPRASTEPGPSPAPRRGPSLASQAALRAYAGPSMADPGLLPRLAHVTCPVLVIWGQDDTVVSPDYGRAYATAFPQARFELIPGAGHQPLREKPDAVLAALDRFLAPQNGTATTTSSETS